MGHVLPTTTGYGWPPAPPITEESTVPMLVGDQRVCLVHHQGQMYAVLDEYSHGDIPLSDKEMADGTLECCMHGSPFDLTTGRTSTPNTWPVARFSGPGRR